MPVKIKPLKVDDYDILIALWGESGLPFRPRGRDSKRSISLQMKRDPGLFLGAFNKQRLVGTVIGSFDGRRGWVNRLAVAPDHRRAGVATKLLERVEKLLRKKGARMIASLVDADNSASLGLFEKGGFRVHRDILYLSKRDSDQV